MQINTSGLAKIDKLFKAYKAHTPGCAIGIIHKGKLIYNKGFGSANLEYAIPITPNTVFDIASVSKQFTAACALILEFQGKLSLQNDIKKYLPELNYHHTITLHHLIHHTSGIPDYCELMELAGMPFTNDYPEAQIIELIARQPLNFQPGKKHLYSNSGYFLLAEIIARVSGKSLNDFATEHIFKPLKMKHTQFYDDHTRIIKNRAVGYTPKDKGFAIEHYKLDVVGDGAVHTTIKDLFLWDQNFYENKLIGGQAFIDRLLTAGKLNSGQSTSYGFGLSILDYQGQKIIFHNGGWAGFCSEFTRLPEHQFSLIILSNRNDYEYLNTSRIIRLLFPALFTDKKVKKQAPQRSETKLYKISMRALQAYVGTFYSKQLNVSYSFSIHNKTLILKLPYAKEGLVLQPSAKDIFKHDSGLELHFKRNARGDITGFMIPGYRALGIKFKKP